MDGDVLSFIIFIGMIIGIFGTALIASSIHNYKFDKDCLMNYANNYCEQNNLSYTKEDRTTLYFDKSFVCSEEKNERLTNYVNQFDFNYLDSEIEDCLIKNKELGID